jgi:hypothetical protein
LPAEAEQLAAALSDPLSAAALRRASFALSRRLAIWETLLAESRLNPATPAAALPRSFHDLLAALEQYESTGLPSDAAGLAHLDERFAASQASIDRKLADCLDNYYRNANVRLVLAADLLNRLAPDMPANSAPVNDVVLGRPVRGTSTTSGQLFVQLVPDPVRLNLLVEARGRVQSQTLADAGPATFRSTGEASYSVQKSVIVSAQSAIIAPASAAADSDSQLTGVNTRFDGRPVLGPVARNRAIVQHEALHDEAQREVDEKIAARASQRMDDQVDSRLQQVKTNIRRDVLDPLEKLDLDVEPVALATSAERITLRLRLASAAQLGSHTPRPQAPSDSLASLQLHESALNNFLDHLQLAGRTFTLPELFSYLADRTSRPKLQPPADLPEDVAITFANRDPVAVRCDNGVVRLTFAIAELRQRNRAWHDFSITATYRPEIEHLHVRLARQGPIELGGDTYRGQAEPILRGIFSKLLPRERQLELIPPVVADSTGLSNLSVTQCAIEEGWIGLAIGPNRGDTPRNVAQR